jgi:hypothetical protein
MKRRGLLKLGAAAGAVLVIGGGLAALATPGVGADGKLTPAGRLAVGAVARGVLDDSLGDDEAALARQLDGFDAAIANFPVAVRAELAQLLGLLLAAPGRLLLFGTATPLHELERAELQAALQTMRTSSLALRQQAYFALRDLNAAAFYAEPAHWVAIGYPGPMSL